MIETDRIRLRPIEMKDSAEVFAYRSDAETNKYQGFVPSVQNEMDDFIRKNPDSFNQPESWFQWVIIAKESDKIIGDIGVHFIGEDGYQCELGCTLSKSQQGKGYATEAMKGIIEYLFKSLNKHRITGSIDPENRRSLQLLERLGFRKEAHFKESLLWDGKWVDDVIFGLLKKDWEYEM